MANFQSLRGMVDLLPMHTERWQLVEDIFRKHFSRAGLQEIRTPLIEVTDLFARGIGEATDVVGKEMYSFLDRGKRSCTLRPEGTASVVRALIQHGLLAKGPQRLWYSGPMFRYERPQAGRQRQFHQVGVEFFGLQSVMADAELISIAWDLLSELQLKELTLELNTLGTFDDRMNYHKHLVSWLENNFKLLDKDSQDRLYKNPLRILDSKEPSTKKLLEEAPLLKDFLCDESLKRFSDLKNILKNLEIPFTTNDKLVRGLDYYCHTAFEITSKQLGAQSTICGGGRYDRLVEQLGGKSTPSIGWAIGMERLMMLLQENYQDLNTPDAYVINRGIDAELEALSLARKLRAKKLSIDLDISQAAFSKQFKRANRSNAKWAIIIGEDEIKKGEVQLKRLATYNKNNQSNEHNISISDFEKLIQVLSDN
ncbi:MULTISPECIES: histidine--tRNA ligase [Prochlorococcus]|uniref:histidine--tRNA ligase n=1 Tax=Prochlorococcus TaxID=1218 RepID=UPI00068C6978|nr:MULTISPECIES: histidine--tRNA ligase [Prochlorococcus]